MPITREEFDRRIKAGDFLEHALVHGHLYGTPKSALKENLIKGIDVLIDIDTPDVLERLRSA